MALCVAQLSKREEEKSKIAWGGEALGLARGDVLHLAGLRGNTGTQGRWGDWEQRRRRRCWRFQQDREDG